MDRGRRAVLTGAAGALAGLAGCSAFNEPPALEIARVWFPSGGDANGKFAVSAAIENHGVTRAPGMVYLYATVHGNPYVRSQSIDAAAKERVTVTASFPMSYDDAVSGNVGAHADVVEKQ